MKLKRFGAFLTALTLSLSLPAFATETSAEDTEATVPAVGEESASTERTDWAFIDISHHFARDNIQALHEAGMVNGYDNGDGTYSFYPTRTMSAAEAILFCTRIAGVDDATQELIYADRKEQMQARIPAGVESWAGKELSVAVELGVITLDELEDLNQIAPTSINSSAGPTSYLAWNLPREQVCMYLVRGMGLENLAQSLSVDFCTSYLEAYFSDVDSISPAYRPYVYLLRNYGIFNGKTTDQGETIVAPQDSLTRGEMIAFVARCLSAMEEMGLYVEPAEYTTYEWAAGTVVSTVSNPDGTISLTLSNDLTGETVYTLSSDVFVYDEYNILGALRDLVAGRFVRLVRDEMNDTAEPDGTVLYDKVLLFDSVTTVSGTVKSYTDSTVTLNANGVSTTYKYSRFTQFKAGNVAGDKTVVDLESDYTNATCYVDSRGTLVGVSFSGGTVPTSGLISAVSVVANGTVLTLTDTAGIKTDYVIPATASVTVNQTAGTLSTTHVGRPATLRITESSGAVASVSVDTLTLYAQGPITAQEGSSAARTITIENAFDSAHSTKYTLAPSAVITFDGETRTVDQIENGWFATVKVVGGMVSELTATSAVTKVEGILSGIVYGDSVTTLTVKQTDGGEQSYVIDMAKLKSDSTPAITRDGKSVSPAQLRKGDSVVVTLRYHALDKIEATPREADLKGEITAINQSASGMTVTVLLTDGTEGVYSVSTNVAVTKDSKALTYRDLNVGDTIAFIANGDALTSAEILSVSTAVGDKSISGTIYGAPDTTGTNRIIYLRLEGVEEPVQVDLKTASSNGALLDTKGNKLSVVFGGLESGDEVTVFGSWNGAVYVADMLIKTNTD